MVRIELELSDDDVAQLLLLVDDDTWAVADSVAGLIEHLARAAATGVRRRGSWERAWITQATGWHDGYRMRGL